MPDLSASYMGLALRNPIIVGASALTASADSIRRLEEAGAGAVVTKSLFEEQIQLEHFKFDEDLEKDNCRNPEMITVHPNLQFAGPREHLLWVEEAKKAVRIPVIASLNAVNRETWIEYAQRLRDTGVDALECNLFASPKDPRQTGAAIEEEQVDLLWRIKQAVQIPLGVKLSPFYTNSSNVVHRMAEAGANGFVLFNRLFEPDIEIQGEKLICPFNLSHGTDYRLSLRYAGLLDGEIAPDICANSGIFGGEQAVKMILAGASAVQVVSTLLLHGPRHLATMLREMETWMTSKGYARILDFRGKLSRRHCSDPWAYTRAQYARLLMRPDEITRNFPTL